MNQNELSLYRKTSVVDHVCLCVNILTLTSVNSENLGHFVLRFVLKLKLT